MLCLKIYKMWLTRPCAACFLFFFYLLLYTLLSHSFAYTLDKSHSILLVTDWFSTFFVNLSGLGELYLYDSNQLFTLEKAEAPRSGRADVVCDERFEAQECLPPRMENAFRCRI